MTGGVRVPIEKRFWDKVSITSTCWLWTGAKQGSGHGQIRYNDRSEQAHRVAWILAYGSIPVDMRVLHTCDNPPCVRVEHLFLGTMADNSRDMKEKGRSRTCGSHLNGEVNPAAKLRTKQVLAIRNDLSNGAYIRATARKYGVSQSTVQRIARGTHWKHIHDVQEIQQKIESPPSDAIVDPASGEVYETIPLF